MLFDDHKKALEVLITQIDNHKKILTIKRTKYMNEEYENFITSGLKAVSIADHLTITRNVRLRKGDQVAEAIGIIIQGLHTNEEVVKYLVDQLDSDFCHINNIDTELQIAATKEQLDLVDAIEAMILPELKEINGGYHNKNINQPGNPDFPLNLLPLGLSSDIVGDCEEYDDEDLFDSLFSSVGDINISGGGYSPCAGIIFGKGSSSEILDSPGYLRNFPICPNIGLTMLSDLYKGYYSEYLRNLIFGKAFKSGTPDGAADFTNMQNNLLRILKLLHSELTINSRYIRDCSSCPYVDNCN